MQNFRRKHEDALRAPWVPRFPFEIIRQDLILINSLKEANFSCIYLIMNSIHIKLY